MGAPIFVARQVFTNGGGAWDSLSRDQPRNQPRITFDTASSLDEEPNTAEIRVYNLDDDTVNLINDVVVTTLEFTPEQKAELMTAGASIAPFEVSSDNLGIGFVELSYGYADSETIDQPGELDAALGIGFAGQIIDGPRVVRDGQDTLLVMTASDGGGTMGAAEALQLAGGGSVPWAAKSYTSGTRISVVLADLINAIGLSVERDRLDDQIVAAFSAKGYSLAEVELGGGYNASGPPRPQIEAFLRNLDLLWSIQRGEFLILDETSTIPGFEPLVLGPDEIIGTPKRSAPNDLEVTTAANPEAIPGRPVTVSTNTINARYRLFEAVTSADTYSGGQTVLKMSALGVI